MEQPQVSQPEFVVVKLFPHQLTAIAKMEFIEATRTILTDDVEINTDIAIYSDPIGSGKTLSMIGLIARDEMKVDSFETTYYETSTYCSTFSIKRRVKFDKNSFVDSTFVVASNVIIAQWEKELGRTELAYYTLDSKKAVNNFDAEDASDYDVVLCTATMYRAFFNKLGHTYWKRFIMDEADSTHIPNMGRLSARFSWFVTSTPDRIEDLYRKKSWVARTFSNFQSYVHLLIVQNSAEYVEQSKNVMNYKMVKHRYAGHHVVNLIAKYVDQNIINMIEAGNVSDAIKELGGETANENIVDLVCKKLRADLNHAMKHYDDHKHRSDKPGKKLAKEWEEKIAGIKSKIQGLEERYKESLDTMNCSVCQLPIENPVLVTCCQNVACAGCLTNWMKDKADPTCPFCRALIKNHKLIYISNKEEEKTAEVVEDEKKGDENEDESQLQKQDIILRFAQKNKDAKIIVFSEHDSTAKTLFKYLEDEKVTCSIVQGSKVVKQKRIKDFKEGRTQVLFINSRENGSGIDLPMTTDIFIYHPMKRDVFNQAVGRGQRIGRTNILSVHVFENDGESIYIE